jgi:glycosyltransferase domain-containing protein
MEFFMEKYMPLVTIGIPTYNREGFLAQAIYSALSQTYLNIEIIISDNCSTDQTQELCEQYLIQDNRIKYIRQLSNIGPTLNFLEVLRHANGAFFMWLGDDDWIDSNYIEQCTNRLLKDGSVSIVSGYADYYKDEKRLYTGTVMNLLDDTGPERLMNYFSQVRHNSVFYGVMRTDEIRNVGFSNVLGGDLLLVAAMAFTGKVISLETTRLHRRRGGESQDNKKLVKSMSLFWLDRYFPRISVAYNVFHDITQNQRVYRRLNAVERHYLAVNCVFRAFVKKIMHMMRNDQNSE